jgi:hypothetical protein
MFKKKEAPKIPSRQAKPRSPDDGPDDMELTVQRRPAAALNAADSVFGAATKEWVRGVNTRGSVFDETALFRTK